MRFVVHSLPWQDVDPASHPYDPAKTREIAEQIVRRFAALMPPTRDPIHGCPQQGECVRELAEALVACHGAWVVGWTWATSEPGGGGPVASWCCERDSVLLEGEPAEETIERVVRSVGEWRAFLEELAGMQASIRKETASLPFEDAVERAAARYLPLVVAKTRCYDAWYGTFWRIVTWHLEASGHEDRRIGEAVERATSGRFRSWVTPPDEVARGVLQDVALGVAEVLAAPAGVSDALAEWLERRAAYAWTDPYYKPRTVRRDGHRLFIDAHDRPRSAERAARMHEALDFVRERANEPLSWPLLRGAQRRVLGGRDIEFRRSDAFGKGGRERYGLSADTQARFERCLEDANDTAVAPHLRAARAYLDVCFFHPFPDGNGRAARLALDHVLTSAGCSLAVADPVFLFACHVGDEELSSRFSYLLGLLAGPREAPRT